MTETTAAQTAVPSNWNIPNALTLIRIVLVPVFVVLLASDHRWWALTVFAIAAFTDFLDGVLARRWTQSTAFGQLIDPIADKLLTGAAFVTLSAMGELWWWVTALILFREIAVTVHRLILQSRGRTIPAEQLGKYKAALQMIAIVVFVAPDPEVVLMGGAVALTLASGADYIRKYRRPDTP